jgi:hypothetical protein
MNGIQVSSTAGLGNIPTNWSVVGTGDFNGDGKTDIVWRDTAGDTSIWLMNGATVLSAGGLGNVPTTWSLVQTGDYNGDGKSDLLWRDTSGNTAIWFMNGMAVSSSAFLGNIPTTWAVQRSTLSKHRQHPPARHQRKRSDLVHERLAGRLVAGLPTTFIGRQGGLNSSPLLAAALHESGPVMGFGCRPTRTCQRALGPASESRQRTKPRGVGHPADQRALWGIGWHRCWSMGPKMLHRHDERQN